MVVCTLCSCYPWEVLGLPPGWYKSAPYRSRAVRDPKGVLADFGVTLPPDTAIRVWELDRGDALHGAAHAAALKRTRTGAKRQARRTRHAQ